MTAWATSVATATTRLASGDHHITASESPLATVSTMSSVASSW